MPAISVLVDNTLIARVRTDGLDVLAVSVGGTKVDETFATYPSGQGILKCRSAQGSRVSL